MTVKKINILILILFIVSLMFNIFQFKTIDLQRSVVTTEIDSMRRPPEILNIDLLSINDEVILKDNWYIVPQNGKIKLRIEISGDCTEMEFYVVPTGTEVVMEQKIIGYALVAPGEQSIEYILDV